MVVHDDGELSPCVGVACFAFLVSDHWKVFMDMTKEPPQSI